MGRAAGAHGLDGEQIAHHLGEGRGRAVGQGVALLHQSGQQLRRRLAIGAGPEFAGAFPVVMRQPLQRLGQGAASRRRGRIAAGERAERMVQGGAQGLQHGQGFLGLGRGLGRILLRARDQAGGEFVPALGPGAAQAAPLQPPPGAGQHIGLQAQPHARMLGDGQQRRRLQRLGHGAGDQPCQYACGKLGERRAGRAIHRHVPTRQVGRDAPAERGVRRDQGGCAARRLQRLAQQQGADLRGLLLGAGGDQAQAQQPLGDRVDAIALALGAQLGDGAEPVGGGVGGA